MSINPQILKSLESNLRSFAQAYQRLINFVGQVDKVNFFDCDIETAKKIFSEWQNEIAKENEQISQIRKLWPDGALFSNKLKEFTGSQIEYINNIARWREYIQTNNNSKEKHREFVLKGRELTSRNDQLLYEANVILNNATDLDMSKYFEKM